MGIRFYQALEFPIIIFYLMTIFALGEVAASRAVFVIVFGSGGRAETLLGPAK